MPPPRKLSHLARAHALLDRIALVDAHNDLPWVIRRDPRAQGDVAAFGLGRRRPGRDTDIPRLRAGKVRAQFWAAFVPTGMPNPARTGLEQIDLIERIHELHPDVFLRATRASVGVTTGRPSDQCLSRKNSNSSTASATVNFL